MYDAYDALELAKYIVTKCIKDHCPISNLQLQKILYFIQREFLQNKGRAAFHDDIQAWQYGPVVREVYYYFCSSGAMPIDLPLLFIRPRKEIDPQDQIDIDRIVEEKRKASPWQLVSETHKKDGAWDKVFASGVGYKQRIPIELIRDVG